MIALAAAGLVTGLILGWLLRAVIVTGEISRAQEQMQKKVRYWQAETVHARDRAARLTRLLIALGYEPEPPDPSARDGAA
jgi:hypothetical protein